MAVYKQPKSKYWWYKFTWNGELIRESTKQTNKRVAEQMEAAHKTSLAKGEVGIRERRVAPSLREFVTKHFLPYAEATFQAKPNTLTYYKQGLSRLLSFTLLADAPLDQITTEGIACFVATRQLAGRQISTMNRELQVLRRVFALAQEWGNVEKVLPRVKMLPGERHRERVLSNNEERLYFEAAESSAMEQHTDPRLAYDVAAILLDCALRPEECFRLKWQNVREGGIEIEYGKTDHARRRIPVSTRVAAVLDMRRERAVSDWIFPAQTRSGHIEPSSLKKQHRRVCRGELNGKEWTVQPFPLYTFRHTCLTRWAPHMDPWTLHKLAGHRDMSITKRYIHPQDNAILDAMERARLAQSRHTGGHTLSRGGNKS